MRTINTGVAYQLEYVTGLKGCKECDPALFKNLLVDGKPYNQLQPSGESSFYVELNPDSGFITNIVKKTTTYMVLDPEMLLPFYSIAIP
jgi:hypothetical protein